MKAKQITKETVDPSRNEKRWKYVLIGIVLLLIFNTFNHDYNLDDDLVTNNHPLTSKGLEAIGEIFTTSYFIDNMGHAYGYRPVVLVSFALEHQLFGENPSVSHLFNGVFYLLTVLALFKFFNRLLGSDGLVIAGISALFFAVHPIHSEVVASIKNRDEILALLFSLLSALSMLTFVKSGKWKNLLLMVLMFTIGLLAKKSVFPLAIVLPIATLLFVEIDWKKYSLLSLGLLLPAVVVGSELNPIRLFIITIVGIAVLLSAFAIYFFEKRNTADKKEILGKYDGIIVLFSVAIIAAVSIAAVTSGLPFLMFGILPFLFFQSTNKNQTILMLSSLSLIIVSGLFGISLIGKVAIVFMFWLSITDITESRNIKSIGWFVLPVSVAFFILYPQFNQGNLVLVLLTLVLFLAMRYRLVYGWIFFVFISAFTIPQLDFALPLSTGIILLFFSVKSIKEYLSNGVAFRWMIGIATIVLMLLSNLSLEKSQIKFSNNQQKQWKENSSEVLKEGRPLTYIENTLVAEKNTTSRTATGIQVVGEYLRLMIAPVKLAFYYGFARVKTVDFQNITVWMSLIAYLSLLWLAWNQRMKRPTISVGIIWFTFSIFLFSNWFELVAGMVGERLAFTASAGFSLFFGAAVIGFIPKFNLFKPKGKDWIVIAVLCVFLILTMRRNSQWKDRFTLMSHDIEYLDKSVQAHNLFGLALMNASQQSNYTQPEAFEMKQKAIGEFKKSIELFPNFFNAQFDIGRVYVELGDFKTAHNEFKKAYMLDKTSTLALEEMVKSAFEARLHQDVLNYGKQYLKENAPNELIYELVAYSCLLNQDFNNCSEIATKGAKLFPENVNLNRMVIDSKNKVIVK